MAWILMLAAQACLARGEAVIDRHTPLVIGCETDNAPWSEQLPGESPRGMLVDLWRLWSRTTGVPVVMRCGTLAVQLEDLSFGRIAAHGGLPPDPRYDAAVAYGHALMPITSTHLRRDGQTGTMRIAVLRGSLQEPLAASAFPGAGILALDGRSRMSEALRLGEADAALVETATAALWLRSTLAGRGFVQGEARYLETELRPAVSAANRKLLATIDAGFAALDADAVAAIERRWIVDPALRALSRRQRAIALTDSEQAFLAAHPVIRYGVMGSQWPPVEIVKGNGDVSGITPDFRDLVASRLPLRFQLVRAQDWTELEAMIRRRDVDVTGSLAEAPERRGHLTTTRPYLTGDLCIVSRGGDGTPLTLAELSGKRVAMETGYGPTLWLARNFPSIDLMLVPDTEAALRAVSTGAADAHVGPVIVTTHAIRQLLLTNLRVVGTTDAYPFELRFGVRSDWPELVSAIDKAVASISADERAAIRERWVTATVVENRDWTTVLSIGIPLLAAAAGAIVVIAIWNRRLRREVAQRAEAQAALATQIAFRSALLEAVPEPVVFKDVEGRYLGCNGAFARFYGIGRDSIAGRRMQEFDHLGSGAREQVLAVEAEVLADSRPRTIRLRARRHDGADRDILYSLSAFPAAGSSAGGLVGVIVDISDLESARAEARDAASLLRDITDAAPGVVWRYVSRPGQRGRFTFVSGGIRALHGLSPESALSDPRRIFETMVDEDRAALTARINAPMTSPEPLHAEYRSRLPDGSTRWLAISAIPRPQTDGSVLWDGTAFDITVEKALQAALDQARAAAEAADRAKSRFLAKMSHEIRTPLAGMIGMLRLVTGTPPPPDPDRLLALVSQSAQNLLRVLNDLLDISKIEAGRLHLDPADFDLDAILEQATALAGSLVGDKPVRLAWSRDPALPRFLHGDSLRIRQVLDNLLSNAARFTRKGEIRVHAERGTDGTTRISVTDTGIGFDEATRDRLFQPYEQASPQTAKQFGGTGLGLSICRELATLMGGRIEATGAPDRGATFVFTLPFDPAKAAPPESGTASAPSLTYRAPEVGDARDRGLVVAVVDDDEIHREVVTRQCGSLGCVVEAFRDGAEAWRTIEATPGRFGLVITDIHMPEMEGPELARRIRTLLPAGHRGLAILVLSATTDPGEEIPRGDDGVSFEFAQKPLLLSALEAALQRLAPAIVAARSVSGPSAPAIDTPDAAPAFDRVQLAGLLGTSESAELTAFARRAAKSLASSVERVAAAVAAESRDTIIDAVHAAKGSAASAGAAQLARLFADIQRAEEQGDRDRARQLAASASRCLQTYVDAVEDEADIGGRD
jgi:PAS domain S-box-containing protein